VRWLIDPDMLDEYEYEESKSGYLQLFIPEQDSHSYFLLVLGLMKGLTSMRELTCR
jgi:hypothetical protein